MLWWQVSIGWLSVLMLAIPSPDHSFVTDNGILTHHHNVLPTVTRSIASCQTHRLGSGTGRGGGGGGGVMAVYENKFPELITTPTWCVANNIKDPSLEVKVKLRWSLNRFLCGQTIIFFYQWQDFQINLNKDKEIPCWFTAVWPILAALSFRAHIAPPGIAVVFMLQW